MVQHVAFLGTGLMGRPMAGNLIKRGYGVTVWNRTRAKAEPLEKLGARVADTPGRAVADAEAVCLILENGPVVEDVLFDQGTSRHLRPGSIVIDFSSISPESAQAHARRLEDQGIAHLDAPVSGGPYGAEAGTLAIMVGGDAKAFSRVSDLLSTLGSATHIGPSGCGQVAKLGSQAIVASAIAAVAEALLLAKSWGADPAKVRQALTGGFADSKILQIHAKRMLERDFLPGGHVRTHRKDLDAAVATAERSGLDLPTMRFVHNIFAGLCDAGLGECDHSALILDLEARNQPHRLSDAPDRRPVAATAAKAY